jgi:hypothetical protein
LHCASSGHGRQLADTHSENDMRTHITFALAALAAAALVSTAARAGEEHRELGPHVHGHGTLDIAVEKQRVQMELVVPGMDIVGFEHAASTDEQETAIEKATAELSQPLAVFKLPPAAGCSVADAKVAIEPESHHDGDDDHEDQDGHAGADHDHDEHAGHSQFHTTYALDCAKPAELTSIKFDYFAKFAGAQSLTVNVVTAKAQSSYEVSRDKPELNLAGIM